MRPSQAYYQSLQEKQILFDPAQVEILKHFDKLQADCLAYHACFPLKLANKRKKSFLRRYLQAITILIYKKIQRFKSFFRKPPVGIYLWGDVGMGKTYLMDLFCQGFPPGLLERIHFHAFMRFIHAELQVRAHMKDPLNNVAKRFSKRKKILCFDEFFVNDIADAMILSHLLHAFLKYGVTIVITSNAAPERLYRNGLQRTKFLPAIALIQSCFTVLHLQSAEDYRLRQFQAYGNYFHPMSARNRADFLNFYQALALRTQEENKEIVVNKRSVMILDCSEKVLRISFSQLCAPPRNHLDYLYIAKHFDTIFLEGLPVFRAMDCDVLTNFIHLVDILYDARIKLVLLAEVSLDNLYRDGPLLFEFRRTQSRLMAMQSQQYWQNSET